jgi:DNA-binding MarR family transcriptional regulator
MRRSDDEEVLLALARVVVGVSTRAADRLGPVSVVQLRALTVLRGLGSANLGRLADEMGVAISTASRLVDRLVRAELVDRRPSPRTRREIALSVSAYGESTLDRYDELRLDELRARLDGVDDRDAVLEALDRFAAARSDVRVGVAR